MIRLRSLLASVLCAVALTGAVAPGRPAAAYKLLGPVWPAEAMPVPYCVNATGIPIGAGDRPVLTEEAFAEQVQRAFTTWQQVTDGGITFEYQGFCGNDPMDRFDSSNTVGWGQIGGGVLGQEHAYAEGTQFRDARGKIFEADIIVDTLTAQSYDDVQAYVDRTLPYVLLHETGHFIGLDHSLDDCALMGPYGVKLGLCQDDIDGARALYPPR